VKSDVYSFGVILFELITRKVSTYDENCRLMDLVHIYKEAYRSDNNEVLAMFDKDIKATEDIILLDKIGRLATECTKLESDDRPTMKEVAERLEKLRASWKTNWLY
jgi:serine/threonine protein kinase